MGPERPHQLAGFDRRPGGKERSTNLLASSTTEMHMLWTILVIVVIVLAVIGLLAVLRGRA
jgi:hypothetical protein